MNNHIPIFEYEEIMSRIGKISDSINYKYSTTNEPVITLCLLKGGYRFFSDLMPHLYFPIEEIFWRVSSYESQISKQIVCGYFTENVDNRDIIIVDDIFDSGQTIKVIEERLYALGARSVNSVVVLNRSVSNRKNNPTWELFNTEKPDWFYGYGMDLNGRYRNLNAICKLK